MPYLIDGNNLIGLARKTSRAPDEDRAALVRELADRLRRTRARATLFFDGPAERPSSLGPLSVRSCGGSADEAILREVAGAANPREIVVVTGDRELARRARESGARAMAPAAFWRSFGSAPTAEAKMDTPVDVEDWMRYFSEKRNRDW